MIDYILGVANKALEVANKALSKAWEGLRGVDNLRADLPFYFGNLTNSIIGQVKKLIETGLKNTESFLLSLIFSYYNDARKLAETLIKNAQGYLFSLIISYYHDAVKLAETFAKNNEAKINVLSGWISGADARISKLYDWYIKIGNPVTFALEALSLWLTPERLQRLKLFIDTYYDSLKEQSDNPDNYFVRQLTKHLWSIFERVVARQFGTVKYKLPD